MPGPSGPRATPAVATRRRPGCAPSSRTRRRRACRAPRSPSTPSAAFFSFSIPREHADGDRRGRAPIRWCLKDASHPRPSRRRPSDSISAPRRSPSACAEKLPKMDPRSGRVRPAVVHPGLQPLGLDNVDRLRRLLRHR